MRHSSQAGIAGTPARRSWVLALVLLMVFAAAFVPRGLQMLPCSDNWLNRSKDFFKAVLEADWEGTYQKYHPGVMVMWIAAPPIYLYDRHYDGSVERTIAAILHFPPDRIGRQMEVGTIAVAAVISALIVLAGWLLKDVFNWQIGLAGTLMMAWGREFLANSKTLHLDALMSILMFISALYLIRHVQTRPTASNRLKDWRYLALSAVFGGMALLTKIAAVFIVPYMLLGLLVSVAWRLWALARGREPGSLSAALGLTMRQVALPALAWLLIVALVFVALWPAMWVAPLETLDKLVEGGVLGEGFTPHGDPLFLMGSTSHDPGPLFYVMTVLFQTTFVELTLAVAGVVIFVLWRKDEAVRKHALPFWLLVAYAVFFALQVSISTKKQMRYMLAALMVMDVIGGIGLWAILRIVQKVGGQRMARLSNVGLALVLMLQAVVILPRHPNYGTLYNDLFGGPHMAARVLPVGWWGEGLREVAATIEARPDIDAEHGTVIWISNRLNGPLDREISGWPYTYELERADFLVFDVNTVQRGFYDDPDLMDQWKVARYREPEQIVAWDGIPYIWLYRDPYTPVEAGDLKHPFSARLGPGLELIGYEIGDTQQYIAPDGLIHLTLFWSPEADLTQPVEVALLDRAGKVVASNQVTLQAGPASSESVIATPIGVRFPEKASGRFEVAVRAAGGSDEWVRLAEVDGPDSGLLAWTLIAWLWTGGLAALIIWASHRERANHKLSSIQTASTGRGLPRT